MRKDVIALLSLLAVIGFGFFDRMPQIHDLLFPKTGEKNLKNAALLDVNKTHEINYLRGTKEYAKGNYSSAFKLFSKAVNNSEHAGAQFSLGKMHANGEGVRQDYDEAANWYRKAAEQGYAAAQNSLGSMYEEGKGVQQSYAKGLSWYRKAAEVGNVDAQHNLGLAYYKGKGVQRNYGEAAGWYRKAAEQGYAGAQFNLGWSYLNGKGVDEDDKEAVKWFGKAANQGHVLAQYNLGVKNY